jgi:hypothetical protein
MPLGIGLTIGHAIFRPTACHPSAQANGLGIRDFIDAKP